ncbi:MAG: arsenate reductase ArsC [Candidatus Eremiobacteraeota bacterium]|nr:arsenate reductase ArsC [Candidatus Eremiobacteraeota bacterium]MBV8222204.1 arsenate reductase ArsC [Candidatus Eremiobacteraeota bacterium]
MRCRIRSGPRTPTGGAGRRTTSWPSPKIVKATTCPAAAKPATNRPAANPRRGSPMKSDREKTRIDHAASVVPEVLFVCTHNAGRSQMAAALLDARAKVKVHVRSAGSAPGDEVNPTVVAAMSEVGLDLSKEYPKPLTDDVVRAADAVITMGCGDACPIYPGKRYLDWDVEDPAGKDLTTVRRIRDDIARRVDGLLADLAQAKQLT